MALRTQVLLVIPSVAFNSLTLDMCLQSDKIIQPFLMNTFQQVSFILT